MDLPEAVTGNRRMLPRSDDCFPVLLALGPPGPRDDDTGTCSRSVSGPGCEARGHSRVSAGREAPGRSCGEGSRPRSLVGSPHAFVHSHPGEGHIPILW